jgi:hypothetical protein
MLDANQGVYLVGVDDMQVLLRESGFEINKEGFLINNLREAVSFRARMRLVVATRLQAQQPSFRLRTLSNTPSVSTNVAQGSSFADSDREMRFPSYNFRLKKRLSEPAQFKTRLQFGRAYQPVKINPWLSFTHKDL